MAEILIKLVSQGHHLVLHPLTGVKTISSLNPVNHHRHATSLQSMFWYVDKEFFNYNVKAGVKTKSKAVGVYDVNTEEGVTLKEVFESFPGDLSRKVLSQSQITKFCKHFRSWLKFDDFTLFLCKIDESTALNSKDPWSNLMVVEIELDYEDDLAARIISRGAVNQKSLTKKECRIVLPKRTRIK